MEYSHDNKYLYKITDEDFDVEYDFSNNIDSTDSLSGRTVTCVDSDGTDTTTAMISNQSVSGNTVIFHLDGGTADQTYQIKIDAETTDGNNLIGYITVDVFGSTTLNANLGDPTANSYVTLVEANKYVRNIRSHPSSWDKLSIEGKKRLLIQACKDIDRFTFINPPYYDNQALSFPDNYHNIITDTCSTPITINSFKNTNFTSDTYGSKKSNSNYWKYGSIHITEATPLGDIRQINTSNITTDVIAMSEDFSATPTTNTSFIAFEPLDEMIKNAQIEQALYLLDNEGNSSITSYLGLGAKSITIGDVSVWFKDTASSSRIAIASKSRKLLSRWLRRSVRMARG